VTDAEAPRTLDKDATVKVGFVFKNAMPGGVLTVSVYDNKSAKDEVVVEVKTA
jgi:hypothetical protein